MSILYSQFTYTNPEISFKTKPHHRFNYKIMYFSHSQLYFVCKWRWCGCSREFFLLSLCFCFVPNMTYIYQWLLLASIMQSKHTLSTTAIMCYNSKLVRIYLTTVCFFFFVRSRCFFIFFVVHLFR